MPEQELYYFNLLKKAVATTFLKTNNAPNSIEAWKGDEIVAFQEDLFSKVNARVSEKWFYTYFKNKTEKLPRIDILNLLSEYVGLKDWNTFIATHKKAPKKTFKCLIYILFVLGLIVFLILQFTLKTKNEFHFCFVDAIKNELITKVSLDIKVLQENESPLYFKTDSTGCFNFETKADKIRFVVQSPYHKTDTIVRFIDSNTNKTVRLNTDDYALMLHYYSNANVKDWKIHKQRLNNMIADHAVIYQLFGNDMGVELFSKDDFIRLITIPTNTLKRIEILDKTIEEEKIVKLKFIVK